MASIKKAMAEKGSIKEFSSGFDVNPEISMDIIDESALSPRKIDFSKLYVSPYNTYSFLGEEVTDLASSILNLGILDYPIAEMISLDRYEILSGQKRYLAIKHIRDNYKEEYQKLFPNDKIPCKIIDFSKFYLPGELHGDTISPETKRMFVIASGNQQHEKTVQDFMLQTEQLSSVYKELKAKGLISSQRQREFAADHMMLQTRSVQKVLNALRDTDKELWNVLKTFEQLTSVTQLEEISKLDSNRQSELLILIVSGTEFSLENFLKAKPFAKKSDNNKAKLMPKETFNLYCNSKLEEDIFMTNEDADKLENIDKKIKKLKKQAEKITSKYIGA